MNGHGRINGNGIIEESLTADNELIVIDPAAYNNNKLKPTNNRYAENDECSTGLWPFYYL